jgi:type IV pilus assembly protein PilQ
MKTFLKLLLLGSFAAVGVGVAICVALGPSLDANQPAEPEPKLAVRVVTEPPERAVSRALPRSVEPRAAEAVRPPVAPAASVTALAPPGPYLVQPWPMAGQQVVPAADAARLQQAYDFLRQQLGNQAPPAAAPPLTPAAPPAEPGEVRSLPAPARGATATVKTAPKPRVAADINGKFSIHIPNCEIREVLDFLGEQGGLNILAGASVQGKVQATLNDVDIPSALDAILKSTGFVARREGQFIFVGTPDELKSMEQTMDRQGTRVYRPNYVTAAELQKLVQPLLTEKTGVCTVSSPSEVGIATDATQAGGDKFAGGDVLVVRDYEAVLAVLDQMMVEIDVRPLQVHIEAMILSVKLKDQDRYGVNFQFLRDNDNIRFALGAPETNLANFKFEKGALKFGFLDGTLGAFLDALEQIGDTNVVATPRLMVINKQRAEIQIGEQKGYVSTTVTETASTQAVQFLDIGALLRLRPFISNDGLIRMEIHPELSDGAVKTESGFTLPEKEVTQVTTNIMVRDGCTVVIGGLMRENLAVNTSQVPVLGNLPFLGFLFRSSQETTERREVIVLITPHIVYEPGTCLEGEKAAAEFHRRQAVYADKMMPTNKRPLGRKYFRLAQGAWAAGDRAAALRFAELAVHFDPLNRAAIDLRSDIWLGKPRGEHALVMPEPAVGIAPLDDPQTSNWLLDDLERPPAVPLPSHPLDPGQPGRKVELSTPRRMP